MKCLYCGKPKSPYYDLLKSMVYMVPEDAKVHTHEE